MNQSINRVGIEAKDGTSKYFSVVHGNGTGTKPCKIYDDEDDDGGDDDYDKLLRKTK
jgi:hypothetical protein